MTNKEALSGLAGSITLNFSRWNNGLQKTLEMGVREIDDFDDQFDKNEDLPFNHNMRSEMCGPDGQRFYRHVGEIILNKSYRISPIYHDADQDFPNELHIDLNSPNSPVRILIDTNQSRVYVSDSKQTVSETEEIDKSISRSIERAVVERALKEFFKDEAA